MQYDVVIIGSGPAGYVGAVRAAKHGLKTAIIEKEPTLGGTCLNWGCIPTKTLLKTAKVIHAIQEADRYGVSATGMTFDFAKIMARKDNVVARIVKGVDFLMKSHKIDVIRGEASFVDAQTIAAPRGNITTKNTLIATGSSPARPPIPGLDSPNVLTSRQLIALTERPQRLVIIGAGVIGMEFASFFSALGTQVTVIEMLDEALPMVDPDIAGMLKRKMSKEGVTFHLSSKVTRVSGGTVFFADAKEQEHSTDADKILLSIGVVPNTAGLNLEKIGVNIERRAIVTDARMRTNVPGVYAAGDVNGVWMLAHVASREAEVAVDNMAGKPAEMRYRAIPSCIYTSPEIATVGLSEKEAQAQGIAYRLGKYDLVANGRFLGENDGERGIIKTLIGAQYGELLGAHIFAPYASEMISVGTQGIESELLLDDFDETVFPHPTICEAVREAIVSAREK